jgi:hypothetical protein
MNVLLVIAHYYKPEEEAGHAATDAKAREPKARAIRQMIQSWRGHLSVSASLNIERLAWEPVAGQEHGLDIFVLVRGDDHLLDKAFCDRYRVRLLDQKIDDPRMLPFGARTVFADTRSAYDMFIYSEDDLAPDDGGLLSKVAAFTETFGWRRVVVPNRYEWNPEAVALKTFIDGDLKAGQTDPFFAAMPDEPFLELPAPGRPVTFRRARNPHAGFFALTPQQMFHWIEQPHFNDRDCSFVGPLESAATLGLLKTFPVYKSFGRDSGWLQIQHLDQRFTRLKTKRRPEA